MKILKWKQGALLFLLAALFWAVPVFAGAAKSDIRQTGAAVGRQVKLSFEKKDTAVLYRIYYKYASEKSYHYLKDVKDSGKNSLISVSAKLPKAGRVYHIRIVPYDENGREGAAFSLTDCRTLPGKIALRSQKSYATSEKMKLYWNGVESAQGYEFRVTDLYGKLIKKDKVEQKASITLTGLPAGSFYRVRIRGYSRINGKNVYGAASFAYIAQQPRVKFKWASRSVVRASWPQVAGATSYTVYLSYNPSGGFRKMKTVYTNEAMIPGLSRNWKYYAYVVVNMRSGSKVYSSPKTNLYTFRLQAS